MQVDPQVLQAWDEHKKNHSRNELELEIRSGHMSLIDVAATKEILDDKQFPIIAVSTISDTFYQHADGRIRSREEQFYFPAGEIISTKVIKRGLAVWNRFNRIQYGLSLNLSAETPYDGPILNPATKIENKHRYSYQVGEGLRIDVSMGEESGSVEGEIVSDNPTLKMISDSLRLMFQLVYKSNLVYSLETRIKVLRRVREILDLPTTGRPTDIPNIPNSALTQARNLRLTDLVGDGLIPGDPLGSDTNIAWIVNMKANGTRRLIFFSDLGPGFEGLFTIQLPRTVSLISTGKTEAFTWDPKINGLLIEAEFIPFAERRPPANDLDARGLPRYPTYLIASDIISYPGEIQWRNKTLMDRLYRLEEVLASLPRGDDAGRICKIIGKEYRAINSAESWYNAINYFLGPGRKFHAYTDDGLIFTPNGPYLLPDPPPLSTRSAVTWKEVIKWKEASLNTFDLLFSYPADAKNAYLYAWETDTRLDEGGRLVPFHPNEIDPNVILDSLGDAVNWGEGQVYELSWTGSQVIMLKHRTNKSSPNSVEVAEDAWRLAHNPIKEDTLKGDDLTLMRREHNRQKLLLFESLPPVKNGGVHLDLASGKGGDLQKMAGRFSKILMVEPNEKNVEELLSRRENLKMTNQVTPLLGVAEDTCAIRSKMQELGVTEVDSISMMFALTFFFDTPEHLDSLVATLALVKEGGSIIMTTMDGMLVDASLSRAFIELSPTEGPILTPRSSDGSLPRAFPFKNRETVLVVSPPFNTPVFGRQVKINLPGTKLATTQIEYLVFLKELEDRLSRFNIRRDDFFVLNSQPFLNTDEKLLSGLYVGIRWTRYPPDSVPETKALSRLATSTTECGAWIGENALRVGVSGGGLQSGVAAILQGVVSTYPERRDALGYLENPDKSVAQLLKESKAKSIEAFAKWMKVPVMIFDAGSKKLLPGNGSVLLVLVVEGGFEPVAVVRDDNWVFGVSSTDPLLK
jgi:hypothetical protein